MGLGASDRCSVRSPLAINHEAGLWTRRWTTSSSSLPCLDTSSISIGRLLFRTDVCIMTLTTLAYQARAASSIAPSSRSRPRLCRLLLGRRASASSPDRDFGNPGLCRRQDAVGIDDTRWGGLQLRATGKSRSRHSTDAHASHELLLPAWAPILRDSGLNLQARPAGRADRHRAAKSVCTHSLSVKPLPLLRRDGCMALPKSCADTTSMATLL